MTSNIPVHMPADGTLGDLSQEDKEALARSPLFAGCTDVPWERVYASAFVKHLPHGAFLLEPGESNGFLYVVAEGQLAAYADAAMQQTLGRFVPADCVGEHALIDKDGTNSYVAAQWPSRLIALDAGPLREVMETAPRIALNILDLLHARASAAVQAGASQGLHGSLDFMATHDAVTGLHNLRWMSASYPVELAMAASEGQPLCLALLDVDYFDKVNQALGRASGDAILRQLADSIRKALPAAEHLVRMAGDRFAVLMPGRLVDIVQACERLRSQIAGRQIALRGHIASQITISIGVAQAATDLDDALEKATAALARAKERGRNRVEPPPA